MQEVMSILGLLFGNPISVFILIVGFAVIVIVYGFIALWIFNADANRKYADLIKRLDEEFGEVPEVA